MRAISSSDTLTFVGYCFLSSTQRTFRPVDVRVPAIRFTIVACVNNGLPRQFFVMNEKSRCSILFHLLVPGIQSGAGGAGRKLPGGRWQTLIVSPVSSASF